MAGTKLASFPNSRIKPRPATRVRDNVPITLGIGANTLIASATEDRTGITIRNLGPNDMRYDYFDNPAMATEGFLIQVGEAISDDSPQDYYARSVVGPANIIVNDGIG